MDRYWAYKSQLSVDGLPGMKVGYDYARKHKVEPLKKFVGPLASKRITTPRRIRPVDLALVGILSFVIGVVLALSLASPKLVRRIQSKEMFLQAF